MDQIDKLAHTAATSPLNNIPEPSIESKKSGNYKKGKLNFQGLSISIENPKGSVRSGIGYNGKKWKNKLHSHYGYLRSTIGKDKDHLDVFIGPDHKSDIVVIINQNNIDNGNFDEHKIALGFSTFNDAIKGYLANYDKDWEKKGGIRSAYRLNMDEFKNWLKNGNTRTEFKGIPKTITELYLEKIL